MEPLPLRFRARVVTGAGRGRKHGRPTLNLDLADVPSTLAEGIYACAAHIDGRTERAVMHFGPRPVFRDSASCEVHLIDTPVKEAPPHMDVTVVSYLREVRDFPSAAAMYVQIASDVEAARAILDAWVSSAASNG